MAQHGMSKNTVNKAYHRIRTSDMHTLEGPIAVRCDEQGKVIEWHMLTHEEPFTTWVGGTLEVDYSLAELLGIKRE